MCLFKNVIVGSTLSLIAQLTFAAPVEIAQVVWVKGVVTASLPQGQSRTLHRRTALFEHDIIKTNADSTAEIAFSDSTVISLSKGSELQLDQYRFNDGKTKKAAEEEHFIMRMIKGGFRTITGLIPKSNPENYQVKTPVATIGVLGTDYTCYLDYRDELDCKVDKGSVTLKNNYGVITLNAISHKYGKVVNNNSAPQRVSEAPAVFKTTLSISSADKPSSASNVGTICIH